MMICAVGKTRQSGEEEHNILFVPNFRSLYHECLEAAAHFRELLTESDILHCAQAFCLILLGVFGTPCNVFGVTVHFNQMLLQ